MTKYYRLGIRAKNSEAFINSINIDKITRRKILDGIYNDIVSPIKATIKNKTKLIPDMMGESISCPIISEKFKLFLEQLPDNDFIKFMDCEISGLDKGKYYLLILTELVEMNKVASEYTTFNDDADDVDEITKLVIDEISVRKRNIFRIKQDRYHIFVSENLKKEIEKNGFSGIEFSSNMNLTSM